MKKLHLSALLFVLLLASCSGDDKNSEVVPEDAFIRAADLSFVPEIESSGANYYHDGQIQDILTTLKNSGCNAVRIRLWKDPAGGKSGMPEVKSFAQRVRQKGLKVWLTVHYSDTWADPGNQSTPQAWQGMTQEQLKSAVTAYTATVLTEIAPDIYQIGNETNDGFLWPAGKLSTNPQNYLQLVNAATETIRAQSPTTKIMLHYAGISGSDWYFDKVKNVDYDYIGMSYYPIFHGKSIATLQQRMETLANLYDKKILVAETSYPFTLEWNDWTNNIVGLQEQLIPGFDATPNGQKDFLLAVKSAVKSTSNGIGFCYWGGEWLAFRGTQSTEGSSYENQALYDFNNHSLPVMEAFAE